MTTHIRQAMPRKGGNSFYRDKNDYSKFCLTLCGAAITDRDVDLRTAQTKKFAKDGWLAQTCPDCVVKLLPKTKTVGGVEVYLVYRHDGEPVYVSIPPNDEDV